ncbi:phytanoyl-CoA dioxygenase, peroxisomal-like [Arctopsyche grandis]|uniref:phytanoyl-CoA dioxygenase, peroxisomal-like n=1 Tax=Arctopsyche grandis TaxID=121162 RepID=UPI00406D87B9
MAARRIEVITGHLRRHNLSPNPVAAQNYEYTLDCGPLTKEQKDFYEKNGYLVIKKLIPDDILEKCRQHFVDLCNGAVDKGPMVMMREIALMEAGYTGENLYNKVQDILYDNVFSLYTEYPKLLDVISSFTGPNIMGMHSMLINKPPGTTRHPPHQDLYYFPFRPANRIVASWTAMEDVYKENGSLFVIPGSHKGELFIHRYPVSDDNKINKAYHGIQNEFEIAPESERVYVPMEKGDTVFFHPIMVHGSGPNTTKNFRKAISCHYAASECNYIETKGTVQEGIANEITAIAKSKGLDVDFKTAMYYRAKDLRGERINL